MLTLVSTILGRGVSVFTKILNSASDPKDKLTELQKKVEKLPDYMKKGYV